ncbi:putative B3 domain-containing protein Os04g0346900 isoform X3 [Panicum virgatum]|uniref:putative B3 domain-containing protein Os04g0346900 isoform X3 n=1 Tax=Panicum virgatum TaxID=38727 RepID=UPI0019D6A956|nr:putative B3 domain-containing protein Os04g0346900 isoform X3 [Panicum virgatum]
MASSGDHAAAAKHLRVLLPFTCDSLRIPDELAEEIGAEEALVVGPMGGNGKVLWRVEVGRDGNGAFLGRGWPELADACGVGAGWLLVLRHRGRGVLTVKAFDRTRCLRDLGAPAPSPAEAAVSGKATARKPQFIIVLSTDFMEKMPIPAKFLQQHIPKEHQNNCGWSQFMVFHDITESNALLVRYEGNMVFTVKVFGTDGIPRDSKQKENRAQQRSTLPHSEKLQKAPSVSIQKHKRKNKTSLGRNSIYKIGPPSWIKKQINTNTLEKHLALAKAFCDAIGLQKPCTITLRTSRADGTKSWLVHGLTCKTSSYLLVQGWRQFCQENHLKEGDTCTFNVIETTLWNVLITRHEEKMNQFCYQETPKSKKNKSNTDGQKMLQGSMNYLNKSRTKSVFEIGPPAWVKKEINASTIENHLNLPLPFCKAIGFRQRCMITLKTSTSSTKSWQACLNLYQNCGQLVGGWKSFCLDNGIRVGDVCTMEIIETTLWNVTVDRREDRTR